MINCEVSLTLTWSKTWVLTHSTVVLSAQGDDPATIDPKNATFQITDTKLYVPVVTLSTENEEKRLEQLKEGLKRTVKWNKYISQMTIQAQKINLIMSLIHHLIKLTDCLFCHLKEMLKDIIEILFHIIIYKTSK